MCIKCLLSADTNDKSANRRDFLKMAGAALLLADLKSAWADTPKISKKPLNVAFLPILCAAPLILAKEDGHFARAGLAVDLQKRTSWALVRDELTHGKLDASHLLAPMPLAMSLGIDSQKTPTKVGFIQNTHGQALVMSVRHLHNQNPKNWRGLRFGIPFIHSMHHYLLRDFLSKHGLNPDKDVRLVLLSPPDMIANLRAGSIDGFFGPEPFNQRAVYEGAGYLHTLSKDMLPNHPCCAFGARADFVAKNPDVYKALIKALITAQKSLQKPSHQSARAISERLSQKAYLNQPRLVVEQALTGHFADGKGKVVDAPTRVGFVNAISPLMQGWIISQMRRWGYLKGMDNNHAAQVTSRVYALLGADF